MPNVLSKLRDVILMPDWTFGYNCYEVGHTWTPHCSDAALGLGLTVFLQGFKMYSGLYILSHLVFGRKTCSYIDREQVMTILESSLRSSAFLGFNAMTMLLGFCSVRKVTGKFYYTLCASLPAFVGSLMAIYIEKPSRRSALAFYVANIASECLFNIASNRGLIQTIPRGQVILFTISMTILLFLVKRHGYGSDPVSLALRFLMGSQEARSKRISERSYKKMEDQEGRVEEHREVKVFQGKECQKTQDCSEDGKEEKEHLIKEEEESGKRKKNVPESFVQDVTEIQQEQKNAALPSSAQTSLSSSAQTSLSSSAQTSLSSSTTSFLSNFSLSSLIVPSSSCHRTNSPTLVHSFLDYLGLSVRRHDSCGHRGIQFCDEYVTSGFMKSFTIGYLLQSGLSCILRGKSIIKDPSVITKGFTSTRSIGFGLFLGSFCGIYKAVNCCLRHRNGSDQQWHALVGGLLAGPSMLFAPNTTITLYVTWKMIEACYSLGSENQMIPFPNETLSCIYAASVAVIFYVGVMEPSMLRGSYMKFIDRVTEHKLHLINRNLLDIFGTGASVGYEEYFPDLNPQLCSNFFMETIYVWML